MREKVIEIIAQHTNNDTLTEHFQYSDDLLPLGINSIDFIKIVIAIEEEFNVIFDDEALSYTNFLSLKVLCDYIKEMMENQ